MKPNTEYLDPPKIITCIKLSPNQWHSLCFFVENCIKVQTIKSGLFKYPQMFPDPNILWRKFFLLYWWNFVDLYGPSKTFNNFGMKHANSILLWGKRKNLRWFELQIILFLFIFFKYRICKFRIKTAPYSIQLEECTIPETWHASSSKG